MSLLPTYPVFTKRKYAATLDTVKPVIDSASIVVRKLGTYITIPAFSIDSTWRGASEIIAKFNFTLSSPVIFNRIIEQENFLACVSWKPTSNTIRRYKLWHDVGEIFWNPNYDGEIIGANFAIEIWNIKPTVIGGASFLLAEDGSSILDEDGNPILADGGTEIGTVTNYTHGGSGLLYTSQMVLPTSPYCSQAASDIGGIPSQCEDITLVNIEDFDPLDGDYYIVDGNCGSTILIEGTILTVASFKLQNEDDLTWHNVAVIDALGEKRLAVDQDNTTAGLTPFIRIRHQNNLHSYKVVLKTIGGEHSLAWVDLGNGVAFDYTVLHMQLGVDLYRVNIRDELGEASLVTSQNPV